MKTKKTIKVCLCAHANALIHSLVDRMSVLFTAVTETFNSGSSISSSDN